MKGHEIRRSVGAVVLAVLWPALVSAQSTIAGVVTDATGGVLPGVTVEASSPALIEKTKAVTSDGEGRYTITDLRPGVYSVTFALAGFSTVVHEGLALASDTTMPVNGEMRVGSVEETITVSGATPVVDVQSVARREILDREEINLIPTTRSPGHMVVLVPGVRPAITSGRAGATGASDNVYVSGRGLGLGETIWKMDGMDIRTNQNSGQANNRPNEAMNQEVTYQTSAMGIESPSGGITLNMIPREGGNLVNGDVYFGGNSTGMVSEPVLTDELWSLGYTDDTGPPATSTVGPITEVSVAMGGPIKRDRLWFFGAWRRVSNQTFPAGTYEQGDPVSGPRNGTNWWFPDPPPANWKQAWTKQTVQNFSGRVTAHLSPSQKVTAYYDRARNHQGPNSDPYLFEEFPDGSQDFIAQTKYTNTISSRLMLEAGYSGSSYKHDSTFSPLLTFDRYTPQWYAVAPRTDNDTGRTYNHQATALEGVGDVDNNKSFRHTYVTNLSYLTGSHTLKAGMTAMTGYYREDSYINADLIQIYQSGVPLEVQAYNTPSEEQNDIDIELGVYLGDTWTFRRVTLNGGVRFDHWAGSVHEYGVPAGRFVPWRSVQPEVKIPVQNNVTFRMGAAYDLFANGKTAFKFSFGKYLANIGEGAIEFYNSQRLASVGLDWTDTNKDNIAQDAEITEALPDNFGRATARTLSPDWKRSYNYEITGGVQHELLPNVGANVMYFHRQLYNLPYSQNIRVKQSDFFSTQIVAPVTGEVVTVYNLPDNLRNVSTLVDTISTDSNLRRFVYDGLEFGVSGRFPYGARAFGGWTLEKEVNVVCDNWNLNLQRFCDESKLDIPWRHEFKLGLIQRLPGGLDASVTLVSLAGARFNGPTFQINRTRRYDATNYPTCVAPCVRDALLVAGPLLNAPNIALQLYPPGSRFYNRYNVVNFGANKEFVLPKGKLRFGVDAFNLLNANSIITRSTVLNNNSVELTMEPRLVRLTTRYSF